MSTIDDQLKKIIETKILIQQSIKQTQISETLKQKIQTYYSVPSEQLKKLNLKIQMQPTTNPTTS